MKKIIFTENAPAPIGPYNQAVLKGNTLYTSGQIAINPANGELVISNIEDETDKVSEFFTAKLPWDLTFAYSVTYSNDRRESKISGNSLMVSANGDLTPKWKIGVSTGYDFVQNGVTYTQLRFERDLLSWRMDFNWQPFGSQANWSFFIGIKSGILSDIKYDKVSASNR